eukprot:1159487-Pelagomonas_calceolata.AAC.1
MRSPQPSQSNLRLHLTNILGCACPVNGCWHQAFSMKDSMKESLLTGLTYIYHGYFCTSLFAPLT